MRHFTDLNRILHVFTSADGTDKELPKAAVEKLLLKLQLVSKEVVNMMRTNMGLLYMASSPLGLRSLITALNQPIKDYKKLAILNLFIEIFDVPLNIGTGPQSTHNLLNNYVALLLQAFYHCEVYEGLIRIGVSTQEQSELNLKSRFLLKKIMYLSANLLPEVPQIATLVNIATNYDLSNHDLWLSGSDESIKRNRAAKIIKELSDISLRNPLRMEKDDQLFMQNLSMFQINQMLGGKHN